jgi:plastocyanin
MSRILRAAFALVFAAALAALPGCSNETSSTSPPVATGPNFNFSFPQTGTSHELVIMTVGSWSYRCVPHSGSGMSGIVVVTPSSLNDSVLVRVGSGDSLVFRPNVVDIKSGGKVRWVNVSAMTNHTVTR